MKDKQIRQGDVLLVRIGQPLDKLKPIEPENGRLVLAHGEATGHTHSIDASKAIFFEGPNGKRYLRALAPTDLEHQEHGAHRLMRGAWYEVIRQREYTPEEIKNVAD